MALSPRELLVDLMVTVQADQLTAIQELDEYLKSTEAQNFKAFIESIRVRTVPNGNHDQVISGLLRVMEAVTSITLAEMQRTAKLNAVVDIPVDAPIAPEPMIIIAPDLPIAPDAALIPDDASPLPADTVGGEVQ